MANPVGLVTSRPNVWCRLAAAMRTMGNRLSQALNILGLPQLK
jgi:hypothetical protein